MNLSDLQCKLRKLMVSKEKQLALLEGNADSEIRLSYYRWASMMMQAHHEELLQTIINFKENCEKEKK